MHPLLTKHPKIIPSLRHGDVCDSPFVLMVHSNVGVSIIKTPSHPFLLWGWFLRFITAVLKKSKNLHCFPKVWKCQYPPPQKKGGFCWFLKRMEPAVLSFQNWNWWLLTKSSTRPTPIWTCSGWVCPYKHGIEKNIHICKAQWACACFILSNIRPFWHGYIVSFYTL